MQSRAQCGERDYELGSIAESCVQQSSDAFARAFGELLGGASHPRCKWQNSQRGSDKYEKILIMREIFENNCDRHENKQPIQHCPPCAPSGRVLRSRGLIIYPLHIMRFQIALHSSAHRRTEGAFAKLREKTESLEF